MRCMAPASSRCWTKNRSSFKCEKDAELRRLKTRCALLESLLGEPILLGYFDEKTCSPSWLKEVRRAVNEPSAEL
jgi:hypothetical protein